MATTAHLTNDELRKLEKAHVFHSWSAQGQISPLPVERAEGVYMWDHDGKRYLDFSSQLVNTNIGHQHPKVVAAIKEQADLLCTVAPQHANARRAELAAMVCELAPGDIDMAFFVNGGAEATENAMRMARIYTGRHKMLATYRSYHGATGGSIVLTGDPRRWAAEPGMAGIVHFCGPYLYRSSFGAQTEQEECERALAHLEEILMYEGPQTIAGIILESIVGTNGILVPPDGYLQGVRELCTKHGIVMICDEVMAGFGRAGEWFACDNWRVEPDLICCAKGINSGYVPLGALLISRRIADTFMEKAYMGGLTYSGHPLACAAAVASIEAFKEEGIVENARMIGSDVLGPGLRELQDRHPSIGEVRGRGCFFGVELVKNRETREMLAPFNASAAQMGPVGALQKKCWELGLATMIHWNVIMVVPPLVITPEEVRAGLELLDEALAVTDAAYEG
jgi:taurine---2-oxoglutarate transaminase